ncbi:hypothetical protein PISL3812_09654 [Talaromyces islandicus]|uniref:Uncharacterized protein n=1 Tax=Talaromyces islandicus TaxID=28573 RepID=A0A0U1MBA5_TALIS|nr:hypothetical protein PISL3812_09654 [Talaromyces islandicus]
MSPVLFDRLSQGPTMVLPHSQNHPSFQFPSQSIQGLQAFDSGSWSLDNAPFASSSKASSRFSPSWKPMPNPRPTLTNPSRKRSRDDSDDYNEQRREPLAAAPKAAPPKPVLQEPIYGEGMVLLNPQTGMALSADSQTGTWFEENAEKQAAEAPPISSRHLGAGSSIVPSRKSQRLDVSAPGLDDVSLACMQQRLQSTTHDDNRRSLGNSGIFNSSDEPRVDDVTLLLGISWQRVNRHDLAPAISGWEKYINNHFDRYLHNAHILLKNRSLNAYLVAALPATEPIAATSTFGTATTATSSMSAALEFDPRSYFFLFKEDLTEAQLVGSTVDRCLQNLRSAPMNFEGSEILRASERSPERVLNAPMNDANNVIGNGLKDDMAMGTGMDLDL